MKASRQTITAVSFGLLLACCHCAFALDPSLDMTQYAHKAWTVREGFSKGEITSITQTADGYLWLGTEFGLLRFDGVRAVVWQPPADQHLPSNQIFSLLATRDGTLWVGTGKGLASFKDGKLTQYAELAGYYIFAMVEDHEGAVWASGVSVTLGKLCAVRHGNVECYGDDGTLGRGAFNLFADSKGNLWAGVKNGLWRWRPGPPKFYRLAGEPDGIQALGEDTEGTLLVGWKGGLYRFLAGKTEPYLVAGIPSQFHARRILRDHDASLWIASVNQGLLHVHQGRVDVLAQSQGLSGDSMQALFEDREGSIWVATVNGLDRFHEFCVTTVNISQGLSNAFVNSVLADKDGSVWFSTRGGLNRWKDSQVTAYGIGPDKRNPSPQDLPNSFFLDNTGRVLVSTLHGLGYFDGSQFVRLNGLPGGAILSMAQDRDGNLWLANEHNGLFRLSPQNEIRKVSWAELGHKDHASVLAADPSQGGLWMGFFLGGIAYSIDGRIRTSYTTADGLGAGRIGGFQIDHDSTLWIATEGGLSHLKDGHIATLTSKNGLPCDGVNWVIEDDAHSFWLYMPCGLIRVSRSELDAWVSDNQRPVNVSVFDTSDGVRSLAFGSHFSPQVTKSPDGKIWFVPWDGVSVIDPRHLHLNQAPPPVHIEQVTADGKTYDAASGMRLPALVRNLTFDFVALSLVAPEKNRYRFKLEGWDRNWRDTVNEFRVEYSNLPPKHYKFRVLACNNSGVWNEEGATLEFVIPPAWYQTNWFLATCVAAFLATIWGTYQLRVRQLAAQFNMRLDERVHERTRIARELHDTLLQSFHGLLMNLQTASRLLPGRPVEAKERLDGTIEQAEEVIVESRDAVQGLRASTAQRNDLALAISALGEELAADSTNSSAPGFRLAVEGTPRDLHPILRDEVYRIAAEALRNAFRHAQARQVEVEIRYDKQQFSLHVRDDGRGFDPAATASPGQEGHYGLPGMRERAKIAGGKLTVWSEINAGTEVELHVPANNAYAKTPRRSWFAEKLSRKAEG